MAGYTSPLTNEARYEKSTYKLRVKKLVNDAIVPQKAHVSDAGWDLFSIEEVELPPFSTRTISTGIAMELPDSYFGKIFDRSGNASKGGFHVMAGVVDNGYRGEIKVVLYNYTNSKIKISKYDKIAQMVLCKTYYSEIELVDELSVSDRGDKGFGSTGHSVKQRNQVNDINDNINTIRR